VVQEVAQQYLSGTKLYYETKDSKYTVSLSNYVITPHTEPAKNLLRNESKTAAAAKDKAIPIPDDENPYLVGAPPGGYKRKGPNLLPHAQAPSSSASSNNRFVHRANKQVAAEAAQAKASKASAQGEKSGRPEAPKASSGGKVSHNLHIFS
jgi:type II secretory pathway component GspD/PulD (secretin)